MCTAVSELFEVQRLFLVVTCGTFSNLTQNLYLIHFSTTNKSEVQENRSSIIQIIHYLIHYMLDVRNKNKPRFHLIQPPTKNKRIFDVYFFCQLRAHFADAHYLSEILFGKIIISQDLQKTNTTCCLQPNIWKFVENKGVNYLVFNCIR